MCDLKKKFKNNLKGEIIEDFSKKQSYEPCDEELKEKIRKTLITQGKMKNYYLRNCIIVYNIF